MASQSIPILFYPGVTWKLSREPIQDSERALVVAFFDQLGDALAINPPTDPVERRTLQSFADLGIGPHVIEALLNHVSGVRAGVAGVYNRALYSAEKRAALVKWAEHLVPTSTKGHRRI